MTPVTDRERLHLWLAQLKYNAIRDRERGQPALGPDGRPVRGVRLTRELLLGRDRRLYILVNHVAVPANLASALAVAPFNAIRDAFDARPRNTRGHGQSRSSTDPRA